MKAKQIAVYGLSGILLYNISWGIPYYYFEKITAQKRNLSVSEPISKRHRAILEICPDEHISAVLANSKYDYVLTAISKVESDHRPQIKGDSGEAHGLYQIQPKHWGRVGDSLEEQTKKAEIVLETLGADKDMPTAIRRFNGSGKKALLYQKKVISLVKKMEQRERELNAKG